MPLEHTNPPPDVAYFAANPEVTVLGVSAFSPLGALSPELCRAIVDGIDGNNILSCRLVSKNLAAGVQARFETAHFSKIDVSYTRSGL